MTGKTCDWCTHYNGNILICSKCFQKSEFIRAKKKAKGKIDIDKEKK